MPSFASPLAFAFALCSSAAVALAASVEYSTYSSDDPCDAVPALTCHLAPTASLTLENVTSVVSGSVTFSPTPIKSCSGEDVCGARITGVVSGLGDSTPHGMHIHSYGDISSPDGKGTGGHYNPDEVDHALPAEGGGNSRHVGDLKNLYPDGKGVATFDYTLDVDLIDIAGRGIIVHAAEDDGGQPTGNAGARLAQCVLGIAAPSED